MLQSAGLGGKHTSSGVSSTVSVAWSSGAEKRCRLAGRSPSVLGNSRGLPWGDTLGILGTGEPARRCRCQLSDLNIWPEAALEGEEPRLSPLGVVPMLAEALLRPPGYFSCTAHIDSGIFHYPSIAGQLAGEHRLPTW